MAYTELVVTMPSKSEIRQNIIQQAKCIVVKVGTRVITSDTGILDHARIDSLSAQLCHIADSGRQTLLVSSGAVGAGVSKLALAERPSGLAQLQAVAAIGQTDLIQSYETAFAKRGRHAAQVLLTATDLRRRGGYLNVRNSLNQIHSFGAIAIINENDSVAVSELMTTFGDNDRLASQVAGLLSEALLIVLSDVDGLYDGPPDSEKSKKLDTVTQIDDSILAMAQTHKSNQSRGGMESKLRAAKTATSHGHPTIIAPGRDDRVLDKIMDGEIVGTLFLPPERSIKGRKRWIGSSAEVNGSITIDAGAESAITRRGSSLLAIGILKLTGSFTEGSVIAILDQTGKELARGLSNYPSSEIKKIMGLPSEQISEVLGHRPYECVIHRDNLVLLQD